MIAGLWGGWADDPLACDVESGVFFDPAKLHILNHQGPHLAERGPLNTAGPMQGRRVIVQAGALDEGHQLAAETANAIFGAAGSLADGEAFYADVRVRLHAHGRHPDDLKVLPAAFAVVGVTIESVARRKSSGQPTGVISPLCLEAVRRIDPLFDIERDINGCSAHQRHAQRQKFSAPLVADLQIWMSYERRKLSVSNDAAKAMDYMLKRWTVFARFIDYGRICLTNNAAERALRGIALGRKSWLFTGSDRGGQRAAVIYSLIVSAKMNDIDPQAWLAHVLANVAQHPISKLDDLLPWNWQPTETATRIAA